MPKERLSWRGKSPVILPSILCQDVVNRTRLRKNKSDINKRNRLGQMPQFVCGRCNSLKAGLHVLVEPAVVINITISGDINHGSWVASLLSFLQGVRIFPRFLQTKEIANGCRQRQWTFGSGR